MRPLTLWGTPLFVALCTPLLAWAGQTGEAGYGHGHMWGDGWTGMVIGPFMMILFIALIVAVVVLVVRWLGGVGGASTRSPGSESALDILEKRFARGEIDKEEFEARRQALQG